MGRSTNEETERGGQLALDVLVAPGGATDQHSLARVLAASGHRVRTAANGLAVVRSFLAQCPDLLIIELPFPDAAGMHVFRLLRALESPGCRVPIVAIAAAAGASEGDDALADDIDLILRKPLDVEALPDRLVELCSKLPTRGNDAKRGALNIAHGAAGNQPTLDMPAAIARLGGDKSLLADLIGFFFEDAFPLLAKMHESFARHERESARQAAHSLKGLAANFGAARAVAALQAIEHMGDGSADCAELERDVDCEVAKLAAALADYSEENLPSDGGSE